MKQKQEQDRKDGVVENVASVLLDYDGTGTDQDLIKALDEKYDVLKDKLLLEALKKQLGNVDALPIVPLMMIKMEGVLQGNIIVRVEWSHNALFHFPEKCRLNEDQGQTVTGKKSRLG